MKLYTEEQVRKAIELSRLVELYGTRDIRFRHTPNELIEKLTSIELPSDIPVIKFGEQSVEELMFEAIQKARGNNFRTFYQLADKNCIEVYNQAKSSETIKLPSDDEVYWNDENPTNIGNYIVDRGSGGFDLGRWNGEDWIERWGSKKINVYGWTKIPKNKEQILNQTKTNNL